MLSILLICVLSVVTIAYIRLISSNTRIEAAYLEAEEVITIQNVNIEIADLIIGELTDQNKVLGRRLDMKVVK